MWSHYIELIIFRALSELKSESQRAYLGILWWVLEPALYLAAFYVVFELGLRRGGTGYVSFLLCGLVVWKWIDSGVRSSTNCIASAVGLVNQVYLPKLVFPAVVVVSGGIKFLIILCLLCPLLLLLGGNAYMAWFWLIPLFFLQSVLIFGGACIVAGLVPFVPDFRYVVNYGMTMLFFLSGIFYDIGDLAPEVQAYLKFNPVVILISIYRNVLLEGLSPGPKDLMLLGGIAIVLLVVGILILKRYDRVYPRVIG